MDEWTSRRSIHSVLYGWFVVSWRPSQFAGPPLALIAVVLVGCGGGGGGGESDNGVAAKSPSEIVAATKTAADSASSVRVAGSMVNEGASLTLDMDLVSGKGGRGKISTKGLSVEVIVVGGAFYINGSPEFYRHFGGSAAAQLLQGKWLKAPVSDPEFASLGALTELHKLLDSGLASHGTLTKGSTTTVEGLKVIAVNDTTKGGTLYVATTGKPYPIQIAKTGAEGGKITFSKWDVPVTLTAPTNAVDISRLKAGK
jgi:hypothetical protein